MLAGIGIDIHDVARMKRELRKEDGGLRDSVFTPAEVARCNAAPDPASQFSACFAVKEALLKALGTGWAGGVGWHDVEVEPRGGKAAVTMSAAALARAQQLGVTRVHASTTHDARMAMATVVLEA
jgi:holo-[acyl-carrier protein] synthase